MGKQNDALVAYLNREEILADLEELNAQMTASLAELKKMLDGEL